MNRIVKIFARNRFPLGMDADGIGAERRGRHQGESF